MRKSQEMWSEMEEKALQNPTDANMFAFYFSHVFIQGTLDIWTRDDIRPWFKIVAQETLIPGLSDKELTQIFGKTKGLGLLNMKYKSSKQLAEVLMLVPDIISASIETAKVKR